MGLYGRSFEVCWIRFVRKRDIISSSAVFRTLSPVLIRSHENENHYLCPKRKNFDGDSGFDEAFRFNMKELTRNLMGTECGNVEFEPMRLKRIVVKHMAKYGDLRFPAFVGTFRLSTSPDVLNLVNKGGIGSRRSEGFGMVELVKEI